MNRTCFLEPKISHMGREGVLTYAFSHVISDERLTFNFLMKQDIVKND